jgi:ABC-type transport system involved in multi-copper enzyme maturation permease subunit
MLAVLTIATVFIAVVLAVVYWRTVREILLWSAAIINVLSMLFGLLALFSAVIVFIWAAIAHNAALVPLGITLVLVFFGLLVVVGVLSAVEEHDRDKQLSKFRAWTLAKFHTNKSSSPRRSD